MFIKRILHSTFSSLSQWISKGTIVGKEYQHFPVSLHFEKSAHLTFYFQKRIQYEPIIQNRLSKYIQQGDLVFDIGGNIGQYAMVFSHLCGAEGKVVSFEPDYNNFTFLQLNKRMNRCNNLVLENKGVASVASVEVFYKDSSTGGRRGSFIKEYVGETFKGETEEVTITTFDESVAKHGKPSFVKIDVEGYEYEVIKGISGDISNCTFLVEVRKDTSASMFTFFNQRGFTCICIDTAEDVVIPTIDKIPSFANLLFVPQSNMS